MKSTRYYLRTIYMLSIIMVVMCGCKKLVEIDKPTNTISTASAFGTDSKLNSVMAGLYNQMINTGLAFSNGATTLYGGLTADEFVDYGGPTNTLTYPLLTSNINANADFAADVIWSSAYKTIYNSNAIIENLTSSVSDKITDSLRASCTGEAKFTRAFSYFYLTNFYGDVPLVLTTDFNKTATLPRAPQAQVYDQMVQDLKDAQSLLPDNFSAGLGERIRPNKGAATALLARVYLYQKDWKNAEAQASAVIGNSHYTLLADLNKVFLINSTEAIWQLKQDVSLTPVGSGTYDDINFNTRIEWESLGPDDQAVFLDPSVYSSVSFFLTPQNYLTDELSNAFEPGDLRHTAWVRSTPSPNIDPYFGVTYNYPFKYINRTATNNQPALQYNVMLRLAEQYLIRAEARAELGDVGGSVADINRIRNRAGLPNTNASGQTDLLAAVARERRVELFAEWAHRLFDLKRTGKASEVLGAIAIKQPWKPGQLLYPVPVSEIIRDPRLVQNPGY
ncbi:RagB/SusD family nutrient uptake outer membrane protein [Mucilaginibacter sp.]|uniref:RagB/SusD family nutrient uptake outer membrane protein n=1 Tax=Mucilaginibacter sp. TaxID=1882438 RepID=UPI002ED4BC96